MDSTTSGQKMWWDLNSRDPKSLHLSQSPHSWMDGPSSWGKHWGVLCDRDDWQGASSESLFYSPGVTPHFSQPWERGRWWLLTLLVSLLLIQAPAPQMWLLRVFPSSSPTESIPWSDLRCFRKKAGQGMGTGVKLNQVGFPHLQGLPEHNGNGSR